MAKAVSPREKSLELIKRLVSALDDKKGTDIRIIDVSAHSSVTDYIIIATGSADQHLRGIRMEVERVLEELKVNLIGIDAEPDSGWTVVDAFDVMIHLFRADQRANYDLEKLWKSGVELPVKKFITQTERVLPDQAVLISGTSKTPIKKTAPAAKPVKTARPEPKEKIIVKKAIARKTAAVKSEPAYAQQAAKTNSIRKKAEIKLAEKEAAIKAKPLSDSKRKAVKKIVAEKEAKAAKLTRAAAKQKVKTVAKAKVPAKSTPKAGVVTRRAK